MPQQTLNSPWEPFPGIEWIKENEGDETYLYWLWFADSVEPDGPYVYINTSGGLTDIDFAIEHEYYPPVLTDEELAKVRYIAKLEKPGPPTAQ